MAAGRKRTAAPGRATAFCRVGEPGRELRFAPHFPACGGGLRCGALESDRPLPDIGEPRGGPPNATQGRTDGSRVGRRAESQP